VPYGLLVGKNLGNQYSHESFIHSFRCGCVLHGGNIDRADRCDQLRKPWRCWKRHPHSGVILDVPGAIVAGSDTGVMYSGGERTTVPFNTALNPPAASPFTIELWVFPTFSDNDDTPLSNRQASGNRSGWTFFQRADTTGWNFRMYNRVGSNLGWDLTGGTSTLNAWSHIVATWNGSAAVLYVNGVLADNTNDSAATGVYNPNTAALSPVLSIAANFDGGSPSTATIDEVAFYGSALTPAQIANHYALASSPCRGRLPEPGPH
jgi:hypothetical protein